MASIEIRDLCYGIGKNDIIKNISFSVKDGEFFVLCGPSGAGKTTILRLITGELEPECGDILVNGKSVIRLPMQERGVILVAQDNQLFPHMTVYENAAFALKAKHIPRTEIKKQLDELAVRFRLENHMQHYPHELSGGQKKLAAILRAMAVQPKVLLLDEPFNGLDNTLHDEIRRFILDLQKERDLTVVLITHSKEDAFNMGDRIGFIFNGKLRLCANVSDLYSQTGDDQIDHFLGKIVLLPDGRYVFEDKILSN